MRRLLPLVLTLGAVLSSTACGTSSAATDAGMVDQCAPPRAAGLVPADGAYLGVNLDPELQTLEDAATALGHRPAVSVVFTDFPLAVEDERILGRAVEQVRISGGLLLLTLEPHGGLGAVTDAVATDLATRLSGYNDRGVPVVVRFGAEMNGRWYAWGQQPTGYVAAFRRIAQAVHAGAPGSAMMWAPAYGGGYPFDKGPVAAAASDPATVALERAALDTDGSGALTRFDDPYAPYWPGDDAVDWVGLSLFHWGNTYPWGENESPEPGKFVAQLTGEYAGLGGDDRALPDFYGIYGDQHGKPVAIAETGAFYAPGAGGDALAVKQAWWAQVFDPAVRQLLPRLAMVNWVEREATEAETGTLVDWRVLQDPAVVAAFRAGLPAWARWAEDVPDCS